MFKRTGKKEPFKGADKNNLSENLFELVDSGEITLEEANEIIANEREGIPQSDSFVGRRKNNGAEARFFERENRGSGVYSDDEEAKEMITGDRVEDSAVSEAGMEGRSVDGTNKFLGKEQELEDPGMTAEGAVSAGEDVSSRDSGAEPFRVFETQEEYQRAFDNAWNKRYGKMMREQEAKQKELDLLLSDLGELLDVAPKDAPKELARRKLILEAQQKGEENPESYAQVKTVEAERDSLKQELERFNQEARAREVVANIRRQAAGIAEMDPSFNLDDAMQNPEFANVVFSLYASMPERAVDLAYRTIYAGNDGSMGRTTQPTSKTAGAQFAGLSNGQRQPRADFAARPVEGGVSGRVNSQRKPPDFSRMSDKDILDIQNRVLRGEKVEF